MCILTVWLYLQGTIFFTVFAWVAKTNMTEIRMQIVFMVVSYGIVLTHKTRLCLLLNKAKKV